MGKQSPLSEKDSKYYISAIDVAAQRADRDYGADKRHYVRMYNNQEGPRPSSPVNSGYMNINETYGDTEVQRTTLGYRNPKVFIKSKQKNWYVITDPGDPKRKIVNKFNNQILELMEQQEQKELSLQVKGGKTLIYRILDGVKAARTIEHNINYLLQEKNVEATVERVKGDATLAGMGGVWIDYMGDWNIPCEENEYIKKDDIYVDYVDLAKDVIFDHMIEAASDIPKAKWIARRFDKSIGELDELKSFKDENGEPFFINANLEEFIGSKSGHTEMPVDNDILNNKVIVDVEEGDSFSKDMRNKGATIYQLWKKPSYKERTEGGIYKDGYVVFFGKGFKKPLTKKKPWPHMMDGFPFEPLFFNLDAGRLYPVSDIKIYEDILLEKNIVRHYHRKFAEFISRIKVFVKNMDQASISKLNNSNDSYIEVPDTFNPKEDVFHFNINSASSEFFNLDTKITQEKEKSSMISGQQKGQPGQARVSATATAAANRANLSRQGYRAGEVAKFYKNISRKMIQLSQQYYTEDRMVPIIGNTNIEWTDYFNKDSIQGDYYVQVDVMSMNPLDQQAVQEQAVNILNLALGMFKDPNIYTKVLAEGKDIGIAELMGEVLGTLDITNNKIFPDVPEIIEKGAQISLTTKLGIPQALGMMNDPQMGPMIAAVMGLKPGEGAGPGGGPGTPGPQATPQNADIMTNPQAPDGSMSSPMMPQGQGAMPGGGGDKFR